MPAINVDEVYAGLNPKSTRRKAEIRQQALAMFADELEARLANLQEGETLNILFRIDIVNNGKRRGGRFSQRNMEAYRVWRKAVFTRDGYKCRECPAKKPLVAHHVKAWAKHPELRFDVDNGLTLCRACHALKHPNIPALQHG